jgi:hypothetical protein
MTVILTRARFTRRRVRLLLAAAACVAIGMAVWLPSGAGRLPSRAGGFPWGARVVTVTPMFGTWPDDGQRGLDHEFTVTDPAKVARIVALITGLGAPVPGREIPRNCGYYYGAVMDLTFATSPHGSQVAFVTIPYTNCPDIAVLEVRGWIPFTLHVNGSTDRSVQRQILAIAGVRWPYAPNTMPQSAS